MSSATTDDGGTGAIVSLGSSFTQSTCQATKNLIQGTDLYSLGIARPATENIFLATDPTTFGLPRVFSVFERPVLGVADLWYSSLGYRNTVNLEMRGHTLPSAELAAVDAELGWPRGQARIVSIVRVDAQGTPECAQHQGFTAAVRESVADEGSQTLVPGIAGLASAWLEDRPDQTTVLWWSGINASGDYTHSALNSFLEASFGPILVPEAESAGLTNQGFVLTGAAAAGFEGIQTYGDPTVMQAEIVLSGFVEYTDGRDTSRYAKTLRCYIMAQPFVDTDQCTLE